MFKGFSGGASGKYLPPNAGDLDEGSILGSGRSPGGRHCNPFQYFYLENTTDRGAWCVHRFTESDMTEAT